MLSLRFIPNALCISRMLLAIVVAWLLHNRQFAATLIVLAGAAVTDGLDGFLAKHFGWTTELGKILDPLADKILLVTVFVTLALIDLVPVWIAVLAVSRDLIITAGAITYRLFFGPIEGHPTIASKINTLCQVLYLLSVVAAAHDGLVSPQIIDILGDIVVVTTLISGAGYVITYSRRAAELSRQRRSAGSSY